MQYFRLPLPKALKQHARGAKGNMKMMSGNVVGKTVDFRQERIEAHKLAILLRREKGWGSARIGRELLKFGYKISTHTLAGCITRKNPENHRQRRFRNPLKS